MCLRARYPCRFSGAGPPPYDPLLTLGARVWRYLLDELDLGEAEALLVRDVPLDAHRLRVLAGTLQ